MQTNDRSSPPTSPQRAQSAARQAERDQRQLGSPPSRRRPHFPVQAPLNMPAALVVSNICYIHIQVVYNRAKWTF